MTKKPSDSDIRRLAQHMAGVANTTPGFPGTMAAMAAMYLAWTIGDRVLFPGCAVPTPEQQLKFMDAMDKCSTPEDEAAVFERYRLEMTPEQAKN